MNNRYGFTCSPIVYQTQFVQYYLRLILDGLVEIDLERFPELDLTNNPRAILADKLLYKPTFGGGNFAEQDLGGQLRPYLYKIVTAGRGTCPDALSTAEDAQRCNSVRLEGLYVDDILFTTDVQFDV